MVSLSTVYSVSIVLASLSAMGAAMVGSKVYPIQAGGDPLAVGIGVGASITGLFAAAANKISNTFSPAEEAVPEPLPEPLPEPVPEPTQPPSPPVIEDVPQQQPSPGSIV